MNRFFINNDLLMQYNKRGIFPFPGESEEDFLIRIKSFSKGEEATVKNKISFENLKNLFDIAPSWASFEYTNKGVRFWEAAVLEVEGKEYTLKLRKAFIGKQKLLGFYDKDEVMSHECCHLARMGFDEPKFEEILAYQTSKGLRRYLGPLFQSPIESLFLMLILFTSVACEFLPSFSSWVWLLAKISPISYLGCLAIRLLVRYSRFNKCKKKLQHFAKDFSKTLSIVYRLTDREICFFSKNSLKKISEYIAQQNEVRWRVIKEAYLN